MTKKFEMPDWLRLLIGILAGWLWRGQYDHWRGWQTELHSYLQVIPELVMIATLALYFTRKWRAQFH